MIPYKYYPNIYSYSLEEVDNAIIWEQRNAPRSESYYAQKDIPYTYGSGNGQRTYNPHLISSQTEVLSDIWFYSEASDMFGLNWLYLLFCNKYADQHQHLGWHADDGPLIDPNRPIVVVSFGAAREIWFREKQEEYAGSPKPLVLPIDIPVEKLMLEHGSVLVMPPGFQQTYLHRIPKQSRPCGPRISLTFRGLAK